MLLNYFLSKVFLYIFAAVCMLLLIWCLYIFRSAYKYGGGIFRPDFSRWQQHTGGMGIFAMDSLFSKICYYLLFPIALLLIAGVVGETIIGVMIIRGFTG